MPAPGSGAPLVKSANWMTHLELDRNGPLWGTGSSLQRGRRFITYDGRGYGLSDRRPPALTFDAMVDDLAAVVDAAGLDRFPLIGFCHGGPIGIAYAARHPERVSCLVLSGTYALGRARRLDSEIDRAERDVMLKLIEVGWGQDSPAFRQVFTSKAVPGRERRRLRPFQRAAARLGERRDRDRADAPVLGHRRRRPAAARALPDARAARTPRCGRSVRAGRRLAGSIAEGRLVTLESENHDLLAGEPAVAGLRRRSRGLPRPPRCAGHTAARADARRC
jgi:pimeloyl-ACP methyl ester carboxylesterase